MIAHGAGLPLQWHDVPLAWRPDPVVTLGITALAVLLVSRPRPTTRRRRRAHTAGWVVVGSHSSQR